MDIKRIIGCFELDDSQTTMEYGTYYKALMDVPFSSSKRNVRVWLPEEYDFNDSNKCYPVIYFSDGQNLVNKYLTAFGDWGLDKVAHSFYLDKKKSFIAVGIDSPKEDQTREEELSPYATDRGGVKKPLADIFVSFIVSDLKPIIDKEFYTLTDKANTAIAGSSMGGLMAFYGGAKYNDTFGFSLDFSPAFLLYTKKRWKEILDSLNLMMKLDSKFYFFVGGKGFERKFIKSTFYTFEYMKEIGFDSDHIKIEHNKKLIHHEDSWNMYLYDAINFWLK